MSLLQDSWTCVKAGTQMLSLAALVGAASLAHGATLTVQPQAGEPAAQVDLRGSGMAARRRSAGKGQIAQHHISCHGQNVHHPVDVRSVNDRGVHRITQ